MIDKRSKSGTMISFPLPESNGMGFENLHAHFVTNDEYIIDNSPFYVFGISYGDTVKAVHQKGRLLFTKVVSRGGHSTYRVKLSAQSCHEDFLKIWPKLSCFGCTFEGSSANPNLLYSIDVPPEANVQLVYSVLEEHEQEGDWEFEEAHYCELMN